MSSYSGFSPIASRILPSADASDWIMPLGSSRRTSGIPARVSSSAKTAASRSVESAKTTTPFTGIGVRCTSGFSFPASFTRPRMARPKSPTSVSRVGSIIRTIVGVDLNAATSLACTSGVRSSTRGCPLASIVSVLAATSSALTSARAACRSAFSALLFAASASARAVMASCLAAVASLRASLASSFAARAAALFLSSALSLSCDPCQSSASAPTPSRASTNPPPAFLSERFASFVRPAWHHSYRAFHSSKTATKAPTTAMIEPHNIRRIAYGGATGVVIYFLLRL